MKKRFYVGIDLGTTNTVVSYVDAQSNRLTPQILNIPQCLHDGSVQSFEVLPSAIYVLNQDERNKISTNLPWSTEPSNFLVGKGALQLGGKRADQLILSAKSWLSFSRVDRKAPTLPWGTQSDQKKSPYDVTKAIIEHVHNAWNHHFPDHPLETQTIALTLPASFDEQARALTLDAAKQAGIPQLYLLEEPQAACYHWISNKKEASELNDKKLILVIDIGGGTCDFSLVSITNQKSLQFKRMAVGKHLLLGGDNIDQALAYQLDPKQIASLSSSRLAALIQQTRNAKEILLEENAPESVQVTLLGSGRKLIGGAQQFKVDRQPLVDSITQGFFPIIPLNSQTKKSATKLRSFHLPYEEDPSFHAHLAEFLSYYKSDMLTETQQAFPDTILLNGGVFNSPVIHRQVCKQLQSWFGDNIFIDRQLNPNQAVSMGAAYYAYGIDHDIKRIKSGSSHALYLAMSDGNFVGILPRNQEVTIAYSSEQIFTIETNKEVKFSLYQANDALNFHENLILETDKALQFTSMLTTRLQTDEHDHQQSVDVRLQAYIDEYGVLAVSLFAINVNQIWQLQFADSFSSDSVAIASSHQLESVDSENQLHSAIGKAQELLVQVFSKGLKTNKDQIKKLRSALESMLGSRDDWSLATNRALFDQLLRLKKGRNISAAHERQWLQLTGYCLRPGYGDAQDGIRIDALFPLIKQSPQHDEVTVWSQYWTLFRRIAGGLTQEQQQYLYKQFDGFYSPAGQRSREKQKQLSTRAGDDLIRLMGALERLEPKQKYTIIDYLLKRLNKSSESDTAWWSIGRLANRCLLYASNEFMLELGNLQKPLDACLKEDWKKRSLAGLAAVLMSQADSNNHIESETYQSKVMAKLIKEKSPKQWVERLQSTAVLNDQEKSMLVGDSLPIGIRLKKVSAET